MYVHHFDKLPSNRVLVETNASKRYDCDHWRWERSMELRYGKSHLMLQCFFLISLAAVATALGCGLNRQIQEEHGIRRRQSSV